MSDPLLEVADQRRLWRSGWRRYVFPGVWLVYLGQTANLVGKYSDGAASAAGYLIIVAFAAVYLIGLPGGWSRQPRLLWATFAIGTVLMVAEAFIAHEGALVFGVYLAVLAMASTRRWAYLAVFGLSALSLVLPRYLPGWKGEFDWNDALTIVLVAFAMYGFFAIIRSNVALAEARAEVARLAAENERSRIARDLHDLLGHSLTTITVKAALARKLSRLDPERAETEIGEVEQLARRSLADVRAAVSGYRDVSLAGELASAREVLRAAGITADLPGAVDAVPPANAELFGWVAREGITNVVRHARASRCTVRVGESWIEIDDDGRGVGQGASGNGLTGLQERVEAAGGTVTFGTAGSGWRLRVDMARTAVAPADPLPA